MYPMRKQVLMFRDWMEAQPFIEHGFLRNTWLWFHILAGGAIAWALNLVFTPFWSVVSVAFGALVWELIEFRIDTPDRERMKKIYGTVQAWFYDSAGDVIGAVACAVLVVL